MYCLNMMRIALELGAHDATYEELAIKFFEHFLYIAKAMTDMGEQSIGLWDDEDDFYYDVLCMPDGQKFPMRLRSMVGLIPLFAVEVVEEATLRKLPGFWDRLVWYRERRGDLAQLVSRWAERGKNGRHLMSLARAYRHARRSSSGCWTRPNSCHPTACGLCRAATCDHPYTFDYDGAHYACEYLPGESDSGVFRRQLELARPGLDAGQLPAGRKPAAASTTTTATTSRSSARPARA